MTARKPDWRPISTAPKNGTRILLSDGNDVGEGSWDDGAWTLSRVGSWSYQENVTMPDASHWMPLHEPPAEASR